MSQTYEMNIKSNDISKPADIHGNKINATFGKQSQPFVGPK